MMTFAPKFPFDPLERAKEVEKIVMRGNCRLYYRFRYQGADKWFAPSCADSVGCSLRCAYCWNRTRNTNFPGEFRSPEYVAQKLVALSAPHTGEEGSHYMRTGGCEPILGSASLRHLIAVWENLDFDNFLVESNGIVLGNHLEFFDLLEPWKKKITISICMKAHNAPIFEKITGAEAKYFSSPIWAIKEASRRGFYVRCVYMPEFTDLAKLKAIMGWGGEYLPENLKLYPNTKKNLIDRGCWELRLPV
jgi:uncharacterized Fe-S cluster-containing radical SAM superfamily protein